MKNSALMSFLAVILLASNAISQTVGVAGHTVIGYREVNLVFSQPLKSGSGDNFENYSVFETGFPENTMVIWGVWFGGNASTVRIVLYGPMEAGQSYTVRIDNVVAADNTPIVPGYEYAFDAVDTTPPVILSAGFLSPNELEIIFSEDIAESGAETAGNYTLYQTGTPALAIPVYYAKMRGIYDRVVLELEEDMAPGVSYTVDVEDLEDIAGNALPDPGTLGFVYDGENDLPRIGLYADTGRKITATDGGNLYSFDMWVWVEPGEGGAEAAIFGIDYPFGVSPETPQYNPELVVPTFDLYNGGMVIFGDCRTEWTWICKQNIIVQGTDPRLISIFPFDDAGRQVAYLKCAQGMPIGRMEISSNIEINCPDARPYVLDAYFHGLRTIDIVFNVPLSEATAEEIAHYEIYETATPGNTVVISSAVLKSDQTTVRLTAGEDLANLLEYTVVINGVERIGGYAVRPGTEVAFTVLDEEKPVIVSALMAANHEVEVIYSEPVEETSAVSLINYIFFVDGHIMSDVLHSAVLLEDGATVRLETEEPLEDGVQYTLKISNVRDLRGNAIKDKSRTSFVADDIYPPKLERVWSMPGNRLKLVFDEDVDEITGGIKENYKLRYHSNPDDIVSVSVGGNEVILEMRYLLGDYYVCTKLIEDKSGNYNSIWTLYKYFFEYTLEYPLPQMGLYVDAGGSSNRVDATSMEFFSFYVLCNPGPGGIRGIEYQLRDISQDNFKYYLIGVDYDPSYNVTIGDPYSGFTVTIGDCKTDWFWMTRYNAILIDGRGFIELAPSSMYQYVPQVATCSYYNPVAHAEIVSRISVNTAPEQVVSTAFQSSRVVYNGESVELFWEMSALDDGVGFVITRNADNGESVVLDPSAIERTGMQFYFVDKGIETGIDYTYKVEFTYSGKTRLLFESEKVSTPEMPVTLRQNKPNPFNPSTTISYYLPEKTPVKLEVFDVAGRSVVVLENRIVDRGFHETTWDGVNSAGNQVSSGIYFYRLTAGKQAISKKMVMLR